MKNKEIETEKQLIKAFRELWWHPLCNMDVLSKALNVHQETCAHFISSVICGPRRVRSPRKEKI